METRSLAEMIAKDPLAKMSPPFRRIENAFLVFLVLSQIYYWYRYALQVSGTGGAAGYDQTPYALQVGKYLMAIGYCMALVLMAVHMYQRFRVPRSLLICLGVAGIYFGMMVVKYVVADDAESKICAINLLKAAYVAPVAAISVPFLINPGFIKRFKFWAVDMAMVYHSVYSAVQFVLFFTIGRMPFLGYENGIVRFGGGWDDPNGFGMFLVLPFLYVLTSKPESPRQRMFAIAYGCLIVALLGATFSYSALVAFFIGTFFCTALVRIRRTMIMVICIVIIAATVASFPQARDFISFNIQEKHESTQSHLDQLWDLIDFFNSDLTTVLFGKGAISSYAENYYQVILFDFGLIYLTIFISAIIATLLRTLKQFRRAKRMKDEESERLFLVGFCFLSAFCMASALIPFFEIYPVNLYFWFFALLMWVYPVTDRRKELKAP